MHGIILVCRMIYRDLCSTPASRWAETKYMEHLNSNQAKCAGAGDSNPAERGGSEQHEPLVHRPPWGEWPDAALQRLNYLD